MASPQVLKASASSPHVLEHDAATLTTFNPFSDEDEREQSSYALVTSLLTKVKHTLSAPLHASAPAPPQPAQTQTPLQQRGSESTVQTVSSASSKTPSEPVAPPRPRHRSSRDRPHALLKTAALKPTGIAPPLVSRTPAVPEPITYSSNAHAESSRMASGSYYAESVDIYGSIGTSIPGFPNIQDDAKSIHTVASASLTALNNVQKGSVSKAIRKGLSREYWMDDEKVKECSDCKGVFSTWRRKHHCRLCGQIFCGRCASNIIKGSRFGADSMIRVCNLCMEKIEHADADDDDDRRSIVSSFSFSAPSPFTAHQLAPAIQNTPDLQSPYTASALFGNMEDPFGMLQDGADARRSLGSSEDGRDWDDNDSTAPFRRNISDEDKVEVMTNASKNVDVSPAEDSAPEISVSLNGELLDTIPPEGQQSSIQFPGSGSVETDSPRPSVRTSRVNSAVDGDLRMEMLRSRAQSRVGPMGEPGWRTRRESTAYAQELNDLAMFHFRLLLRQMLINNNIPDLREWEKTLTKLALDVARGVSFTRKDGADMDIRRFVKIKKLPGGSPRDSEYVAGAVITKNLAHKHMAHDIEYPHIVLFAISDRREEEVVYLDHAIEATRQRLDKTAARIAKLNPSLVLVSTQVEGYIVDSLRSKGISVARNVAMSAMQFISRMTGSTLITSYDKLAVVPEKGTCQRFLVQTYDHPLIPGRRKTLMRFDGCGRDVGCTIILRGADIDTLRRVKTVTRFLVYLVRNLKVESYLWKDLALSSPTIAYGDAVTPVAAPVPIAPPRLRAISSPSLSLVASGGRTPTVASPTALRSAWMGTVMESILDEGQDSLSGIGHSLVKSEHLNDEDAARLRLSREILRSYEDYTRTFISVSSTLRFAPPFPICRMKELDEKLHRARQAWEDDVILKEERSSHHASTVYGHAQEATLTPATYNSTVSTSTVSTTSTGLSADSDMPASPTPRPPISPEEAPSYFERKLTTSDSQGSFQSLQQAAQTSSLGPTNEGALELLPLRQASEIAIESALSAVEVEHDQARRIWEWYLRKNKDDFLLEKYQNIAVRECILPIGTHVDKQRPCFPPKLVYIDYYGDGDMMLGQFLETQILSFMSAMSSQAVCEGKDCGVPLYQHCKMYYHNETRVMIATEVFSPTIHTQSASAPAHHSLTTWTYCRACDKATPFVEVNDHTKCYSFAKFLELYCYPADAVFMEGAGCTHNIYQYHVRYFAWYGVTVRFISDPIVVNEVVFPPMQMRVKPETLLELKNADYGHMLHRIVSWYNSLLEDLRTISLESLTGQKEVDMALGGVIANLVTRAEMERAELARQAHRVYKETPATDTLGFGQVRALLQDRIVEWQKELGRLPKPRMLSDKEKRMSTFNTVKHHMWPRRSEPSIFDRHHLMSSSVSEADEHHYMRRVTGDSVMTQSSASETESVHEKKLEASSDVEEESSTILPSDAAAAADHSELPSSEAESDSTVGAKGKKRKRQSTELPEKEVETEEKPMDGTVRLAPTSSAEQLSPSKTISKHRRHGGTGITEAAPPMRLSRLPKRQAAYPSVAELVRRYQDILPGENYAQARQSVILGNAASSAYDSDRDADQRPRPSLAHRKTKGKSTQKRGTSADFENGYAANIGTKYLASERKVPAAAAVVVPGPRRVANVNALSSSESRAPSRRTSPDKRAALGRTGIPAPIPRQAPESSSTLRISSANAPTKSSKNKQKTANRTPSVAGRSTIRKPATTPGGKVSNLTRQFERMYKDSEKLNRRYTVLRGKKARPVATARAKVEVFDNIEDAIRDMSDSDDSSSEADDEDEGHVEGQADGARRSPAEPAAVADAVGTSIIVNEPSPSAESTETPSPQVSPPEPTADADSRALTPSKKEPPQLSLQLPAYPPSPLPPYFSDGRSTSPPPSDLDSAPGNERHSFMRALSGFWPQPLIGTPASGRRIRLDGGDFEDQIIDPVHIFRGSDIVVRTDEPTSIIAFTLDSEDYRNALAKSLAEQRNAQASEGNESFMPDEASTTGDSTWGIINLDEANPIDDIKYRTKVTPSYSFESGDTTISCTAFFAEQFDALRRTCGCDKTIIESLARCVKWDATGGKSGSAFLKTRDDRFIAKELSKSEMEAMATFAPAYFDYMSSAIAAGRPTLLAKIFGFYRIAFRMLIPGTKASRPTWKTKRMNMLVMENLFYDRKFTKIYDLKGSSRNRLVQSTGRENEVLLDENLVQTAHLNPLFVREHSKRILRSAIWNDTKFLADLNVMDYSLVVGVDSAKQELVVGIVDFVRTYTWDKRLENLIKDTPILAGLGNKNEPTIVTPKSYKSRFRAAMERYFALVPDRWMKQKDMEDDEPTTTTA
ncbi:hypothetical protein AURDEDRAFT_181710 [Auricularia subglabra TFB-10046 SS5]|nr:hypothetical protein AURDEDRAFT_181710 [Auricularia subglabra TFB-10046 SS5]